MRCDLDTLLDVFPDLALLVRRDGILLSHFGGRGVSWLRPVGDCAGKSLDSVFPASTADLFRRLTIRAISGRETIDAELREPGRHCEIQVTAQARDRAVCIIRAPATIKDSDAEAHSAVGEVKSERRGFLRRFRNSISIAALSERPIAVAMIHVDGVVDISRVLDISVSSQVMTAVLQRMETAKLAPAGADPVWFVGQLAEHLLILVLETSDRELIDNCVTQACAILRHPVMLKDSEFHLIPYAGVAILGQDASSPQLLLQHASACSAEARRAGSSQVIFFSDTLKLRTLARLDVARELRDAIENRNFTIRYVSRHDLATGRLATVVAYFQWIDPLRGEIRPADFLPLADATGLSTALSRSALKSLEADFARFKQDLDPEIRISFGALRHHVLSDLFLADITDMLKNGVITPERLELRIAERAYVARDVTVWQALADLGVRLVVDEFGRQVSSLELLARVPLWGLQLDRSWVTSIDTDPVARKVCGAVINVATGLGLVSIATGIDDAKRRKLLMQMGCQQGMGDLYERFASGDGAAASLTAGCAESPSRSV